MTSVSDLQAWGVAKQSVIIEGIARHYNGLLKPNWPW
jgi:hypothetical protein